MFRSYWHRSFVGLLGALLTMIIWMIFILEGSVSSRFQVLVFFSALPFGLHLLLLNHQLFLDEVADVLLREAEHEVSIFGEKVQKAKKRIMNVPSRTFWSWPNNRGAVVLIYWASAFYFLAHKQFAFPLYAVVVAIFSFWAIRSQRLLQWLPIAALVLGVSLIMGSTHFERMIACLLFFLFYAVYRQVYLQYSNPNSEFQWSRGLVAAWRPALVFVLASLVASFIFPDKKFTEQLGQTKDKLAGKFSQRLADRNGRSSAEPQTSGMSAGGGGAGSGGSGGGMGAGGGGAGSGGSAGGMGAGGGGAGSGGSGSGMGAGGGGAGSGGGGGGMGAVESGSGTVASSRVENDKAREAQLKLEQELKKVQWRVRLDLLEKLFKALLVGLCLWLILAIFLKPKSAAKANRNKMKKKKVHIRTVLEQMRQLQKQKFSSLRDEVIANYHLLLGVHAAMGTNKQDWETPEQFENAVRQTGKILNLETQAMTQYFTQVYYGERELTQEQYQGFKVVCQRIPQSVKLSL